MVPVEEDDGDTTAAETAPAVEAQRRAAEALDHPGDAEDATLQQRTETLPELERETSPTTRSPAELARSPAARRPMMTLLGTGPSRGSEPEDEEHESITERANLGVRVSATGALGEVSVAQRAAGARGVKPARRPSDPSRDGPDARGLSSSVELTARPLPDRSGAGPRAPAPTLLDPVPPPSARASRPTPSQSFDPPTARALEPPSSDAFERPTAKSFDPPTAKSFDPNGVAPNAAPSSPDSGPHADVYEDESVTTRGPAISEDDDIDSVTTRAPPISRLPLVTAPAVRRPGSSPSTPRVPAPPPRKPVSVVTPPASSEPFPLDATEGTTKRLVSSALPAEDETDSVTTQAPGHLTNMLRVIAAAPSSPLGDDDDEDSLPENKTAVMANRPYATSGSLPVATPSSGRSALSPIRPHVALGPDPAAHASESGLRIAAPAPVPLDHASMAVLAVPVHHAPHEAPLAPPYPPAAMAPPQKPPSYGMLVAFVAIVSVCVPVGVFYVLRGRADEPASAPVREGHVVTSEVVRLSEPARVKRPRGAAAASTSATSPTPRRR